MRRLFVLSMLASVSGCAQTVWVKAGAEQQDFARDSYGCERDMRQSGYYGSGLIGVANAQGFQERCMVAAGWHREAQGAAVSSAAAASEYDRRSRASEACIAAGIRPDDAGYGRCFRDHYAVTP